MSATTSSSSSSNSSVPALFRCPISLELIKDPVTLCTGVTYDRSSIERWLQEGHVTCPTTMQPLETLDLTPNHILRRLIQGWCSTHKLVCAGPADDQAINQAVSALRSNPLSISDLDSLTCLLKYNEQNRAFMASSGAQNALLHTLCRAPTGSETALEALAILAQLPIQEECIQSMPKKALEALSSNLCNTAISVSSRIHAAEVLSRILAADEGLRFNFRPEQEVFSSVAAMMGSAKSSSPQSAFVKSSIKTALDLLLLISPVRRNRVRVVEAGIMGVLIEAALSDEADRNLTEKSLALLELVCQCAEGRAAVCGHPLGIHLLVKKIARVSEAATDSATFALWHIYKNCRTASVLRELNEAGAYTKLFLLLQIGCGSATRRKAKDILRDHKNTGCDRNPCFLAANQINNHTATMQGLAKLF